MDLDSGDACLDADTLAAWADAALDPRERERVEAHAADCERCQALLAAMVRTQPPPSEAVSPSRKRALWWLAAAAPVAAALAVWFAVPDRAPSQQSQSAESIAEQAAPASPAEAPSDTRAKAEARPRALAKEPDAAASDQKKPAEASANAETVGVTSLAAPAAGPAAAAAADSNLRRDATSAPSRFSGFASAMDVVIVSSNPATRFRLLPGGGVQRSADGGATWRTEVTGATETLTAGVSPSPSVCWLIGRSGTVLLSTGGSLWRRLTFPESVDLRAITATDSESANVTTADGRVFATTDGGQTWSRAPNP